MSDYFHEQMIQKMLDAKPSTWLTDGLTEEEVKECIDNGKIKCAVLKVLKDIKAEISNTTLLLTDDEGYFNVRQIESIIDNKIAEMKGDKT